MSPLTDRPIVLQAAAGRIQAVLPSDADPDGVWTAPGLIDLQVNGFRGVDYNSPDSPMKEIARSIAALRETGVTRFYPTVITGSNAHMRSCLAHLARAKRELPLGSSIAGLHVEGPWISPHDGPRGAHPAEHVRPASIEEFEELQDAAEGLIRIVTLAPEVEGALPLIDSLRELGVVVSLGHTGAEPEQIRAAAAVGATMSTHLGNGAHKTIPRHPNYLLEQMACDRLCAGLIVDGIHLPPAFVKVAVRAKTPERSILVTDAVAPAGCPPGLYRLGKADLRLSEDGSVRLADSGRLAGSALRLDRAVENLIRFTGLPLARALETATVNPARVMNLEGRQGFLAAGDLADLVFFRYAPERHGIEVIETVMGALMVESTA